MRLPSQFVNKLPLKESAKKSIGPSRSQIPPLISQRCLGDALEELARQTAARVSTEYSPVVETITMPKKGYGPRPVEILPPEARTLYEALVERMKRHLPDQSRDSDIEDHRKFGTEEPNFPAKCIVDFDIAACYEYIDHEILAEELLMQTMDSEAVNALKSLLHEMFPRGLGIPQTLEPSHLLSDTYLEKMQRHIIRAGYQVHRFADDFRIVAPSLGDAQEALEHAVDIARQIGLVLADGKTDIRHVRSVQSELDRINQEFSEYRSQAETELGVIDAMSMGYDDTPFMLRDEETEEYGDEEIDFVALSRVIEDWSNGDPWKREVYSHFGPGALRRLASAEERLNDQWLVSIAEREPIRLFEVIGYLFRRPEGPENWLTLSKMAKLPRQSPWARLWMVWLADQLTWSDLSEAPSVQEWIKSLLDDRHETVRVEAAWFLAGRNEVSMAKLIDLYVQASDVTRVGVAACIGRLDGNSESKAGSTIKADSLLTKAAYIWGATYVN